LPSRVAKNVALRTLPWLWNRNALPPGRKCGTTWFSSPKAKSSASASVAIGNLTSQFWSNCYIHPFDQFVTRELGCASYVRYVDDFALFADSKATLWEWKRAIVERLSRLRLAIHEHAAQVVPVSQGVPWLGFVVYPTHRRVKACRVVAATRRLRGRITDYRKGLLTIRESDASVQGWVEHVRHANTWGLRARLFAQPWLRLRPN
jgi:hypothetical protein